ncbi:MAG: pyrroline-5-carboxylate reductase [Candidatus Sumerlaeaceae bacterium]|nr:pyrroline-5-carboxylate reductase [Candidatus Sumerlaeaceae bacterium]
MSSLREKKIVFIGAGNMARAIAAGVIRKGTVDASHILASDVAEAQRTEFERITSAKTISSNHEAARWADLVILAVKPFQIATVCEDINPVIRPSQLVISICAGVTTQFLEQRLGDSVRVVRAMPNTPALIGCGATAVAAGSRATREDVDCVLELFGAVGVALELPESVLDVVTGLSGSGPAYVFYFAEALIAAAEKLGLPHGAAETLVKHTIYGASRLAIESPQSLESLRAAVTTKGGTTEAGLRALEQQGFARAIEECVAAAARRSAELSQR